MGKMIWKLSPIDSHLDDIKQLFSQNADHRHADNYLKNPLFEYTKFSRMGWDPQLVYYSAGIERPEYNGSIRIMSRHTRSRNYNFGGWAADLKRGLETLDLSTAYAINLGYSDIWVSREESPNLLEYFAKYSTYSWTIAKEHLPNDAGEQFVMRITNDKH
jgi:hypothetical protein